MTRKLSDEQPPIEDRRLAEYLSRLRVDINLVLDDLNEEVMRWKSTWAAGTYVRGDVVKHSGTIYSCLRQTTGTPGVSTDWDTVA